VRELRLVEAVQEVALVLERVQALEQLEFAAQLAHARVMARGDLLGAQAHGVVQEGLELDLGVAQHVRVGRAVGLVLAQELGEDAVLVLGGEVDVLDLDADDLGHAGGVDEVLARRAELAVVVVFPVLHEDADHLVALLLEQPGADGGVHPAAEAHHHAPGPRAGVHRRGGGRRKLGTAHALIWGAKTLGSVVMRSSG
jgi:hypothetical protein